MDSEGLQRLDVVAIIGIVRESVCLAMPVTVNRDAGESLPLKDVDDASVQSEGVFYIMCRV